MFRNRITEQLLQSAVFLMLSSVTVHAANPVEPLVQPADMQYQGVIHLPNQSSATGGSTNGAFEYGGSALMFNPANNSLYIMGHIYDQKTAEISIPALGGTAGIIQPLTDLLEGKIAAVGTGTALIGGHFIYNGKLYLTDFLYYDGAGTQTLSHFVRPLSWSTKGQVQGPSRVGSMGAGYYSGYMAAIPSEWQMALGGPALTGNCCLSIISRTSFGPSVSSFDPEASGQSAEMLVYYPQDHQTLGSYGATGSHPNFNGSTRIKGIVFPNGTSSVLFIGRTGIGPYCYGEAAACNDPSNGSKGEHAYPYKMYVWAYNANDLAAVRAGTKNPWDITPYQIWQLPNMEGNSEYSGSAAYDPATNRIFVVENGGDGAKPLIHVFKLTTSGSVGTTPLPPPTTGSACDVNSDGSTTVTDVQLCVNQAIGSSPCSSGDLNKDGLCNVVDVQRVVNSALGGTCVSQ